MSGHVGYLKIYASFPTQSRAAIVTDKAPHVCEQHDNRDERAIINAIASHHISFLPNMLPSSLHLHTTFYHHHHQHLYFPVVTSLFLSCRLQTNTSTIPLRLCSQSLSTPIIRAPLPSFMQTHPTFPRSQLHHQTSLLPN